MLCPEVCNGKRSKSDSGKEKIAKHLSFLYVSQPTLIKNKENRCGIILKINGLVRWVGKFLYC